MNIPCKESILFRVPEDLWRSYNSVNAGGSCQVKIHIVDSFRLIIPSHCEASFNTLGACRIRVNINPDTIGSHPEIILHSSWAASFGSIITAYCKSTLNTFKCTFRNINIYRIRVYSKDCLPIFAFNFK